MNAAAITRAIAVAWFFSLGLNFLSSVPNPSTDPIWFVLSFVAPLALLAVVALRARLSVRARRRVQDEAMATVRREGTRWFRVFETAAPPLPLTTGVLAVSSTEIRYVFVPLARNRFGRIAPKNVPFEELRFERATTRPVWINPGNLGANAGAFLKLGDRYFTVDAGSPTVSIPDELRKVELALGEGGAADPSRPLLVVGGEVGFFGTWWTPVALGAIGLQLAAFSLRTIGGRMRLFGGAPGALGLLGVAFLGSVVAFILTLRFITRRSARVEVRGEGLVFHRGSPRLVRWEDVARFRDGSADYVQLVTKEGAAPPSLAVPTPNEEERTALLAVLVGRGFPREERDTI